MMTPLTGTTSNGVPYLAVPPVGDGATAPVIILWHLMDAPRSEAAFAAALPLEGLDAWKVYLGLPTFGARSLPGGVDEVMKLLATDAPGLVHGPVHSQAAEEFPAAWADLCQTLGIGADLQLLDGMKHALAEEPGIEPAPQTEVAKRVDPIAAEWLREHLT